MEPQVHQPLLRGLSFTVNFTHVLLLTIIRMKPRKIWSKTHHQAEVLIVRGAGP
jgi:hypothetical protein